MTSQFIPAKSGENRRAPSGYRLTGYSVYENGRRVPNYESTREPKPEVVAFSRLHNAWQSLTGHSAKTGARALSKLMRRDGGHNLIKDGTATLKKELSAAGANVQAILDGAPEVIRLTNPAGGLFGAKRKPAPVPVPEIYKQGNPYGLSTVIHDESTRAVLLKAGFAVVAPPTPPPAPKAAPVKSWEQMTWSERCLAAAKQKAEARK